MRLGNCPARRPIVIAVGGGGKASTGGGGSGFVESTELEGGPSYMRFTAEVGLAGEESNVIDVYTGSSVLRAAPGNDADSVNGGSGYSGGGGGYGGQCPNSPGGGGGYNSSDGYGASGGSGSGFDLSNISISNLYLRYRYALLAFRLNLEEVVVAFLLECSSPGQGGTGVWSSCPNGCACPTGLGGGGGGVIVNNLLPTPSQTDGWGYGGGAGGYDGVASPGVILFDFEP